MSSLKLSPETESLHVDQAAKGPFLGVGLYMALQVKPLNKIRPSDRAAVWFLLGVRPCVTLQMSSHNEGFVPHFTAECSSFQCGFSYYFANVICEHSPQSEQREGLSLLIF